MSDDIASLGIKFDATEADAAKKSLDGVTASAANTEKGIESLTFSAKDWSAAMQANNNDMAKALASLQANATALNNNTQAQNTATAAINNTTAAFNAGAQAAARQATALNGAALTMAQQMGNLGSSSVQAARQVGASAQSAASAVAGAAASQVASHARVAQSGIAMSTAIRESLVLMREASVGNFTRMAGSASILISALGGMYYVLLPLVAIVGVLGAAMALATNQINEGAKGSGDLTRNMGLTAEQLERVQNKYVTVGDTTKAFFQTLAASWGLAKLDVQGFWNLLGSIARGTIEEIVQVVAGGVGIMKEAWSVLPTFLGGSNKSFSNLDFGKAFTDNAEAAKKSLNGFYDAWDARARQNARERIKDEAGDPAKAKKLGDGGVGEAQKRIQELNDQTKATQSYTDALGENADALGAVLEKERVDNALKSVIARLEQDTVKTGRDHTALIDELRNKQEAYNRTLVTYKLLKEQLYNEQEEEILDREVDTLRLTNLERAKSLAQLKEEIILRNLNVDPNSDKGKKAIQSAVELAAHQETAKEIIDETNFSLSYQSKLLDELASHAQAMADGLGDAFGTVGKAIEGLTKTFTNYSAQQAKFDEQQADINKRGAQNSKEQLLLTQARQDADTEYYANVLDSAKNFFEQGSAGYKILQAAEMAYRVYQTIASIEAIAQKETETAATVASNTVETASNTATGASKMFAELGPWAFPVVAAMLALMASLGGGGGSTASSPPVDIAKERQAAQGSGTVLGDAAAKSDSIAKSLEELTKDTNKDLEYSNAMVTYLKGIQDGIGDLTAKLARQLAVGGLFDTSSLGLGTTSSGGSGLLSGLFGSSTTTKELLDQGITLGATTVGQAIARGISATAYQTTQTTKQSSGFLFGLFGGGTKTTTQTTQSALGGDITQQFGNIIGGLRNTVLALADSLGVQGAQAVIDSFSVNLGSISFKNMTGSQIQDALNSVFSALGDNLAAAAVPVVTQLQQVGEGALQTLARLVNEYTVVDDAAKTVGFTFSQTGVNSLAARDRLVQLSGGLDNFTQQAGFFVDNFENSLQQLAPIQKAVRDEMARLGYAGVTTKAQFTSLVQGIDTSTEAGAALYAALQNVAPAFAKVADAVDDLNDKTLDLQIKLLEAQGNALAATALQRQKDMAAMEASLRPLQAVVNATEDLSAAYQNESGTIKDTISKYNDYVTSLKNYRGTLDAANDNNNPIRAYMLAKSNFQSTAAAAANGDTNALNNFQNVASAFLSASQAVSLSRNQTSDDLIAVKTATDAATAAAQQQVDMAQEQLDALNASVDGLLVLNQSVLSVRDAILALQGANANVDPSLIPGHAGGLNRVPYNNYVARLHANETVLNAGEAEGYRRRASNDSSAELLLEIRGMRTEQKRIAEQTEANTRKVANIMNKVTQDGIALQTKEVA